TVLIAYDPVPHITSTSPTFPYTTLFRSGARSRDGLRHGLLGSGLRPRCVIPRRTRYTAAVSFFDPQSDPRTGWRARVYDVIFERSEEHTSELQSRENLVCRLLLEKKKKQ